MNIIAIDIGNSNINIALFLKGEEKFIKSFSCESGAQMEKCLVSTWGKIGFVKRAKVKKRDGVIVVSSVNADSTRLIRKIAKEKLGEKIYLIGKDIPLPLETAVEKPEKVGTDRIVAAAAAYAVADGAVVVADFGTAVTIDLVDDEGVFLGGVICPGFEIAADALKEHTAQLPKVTVSRPKNVYGKNTAEAIICGLYYSAVGTLEEVIRRYAESLGKWPQTIITGTGAAVIKDDCQFIDSYVTNLVVKGIALTYRKYIEEKT